MKRNALVLLAAGLAATLTSCQYTSDAENSSSQTTAGQAATSDFTLITLKVPHMV